MLLETVQEFRHWLNRRHPRYDTILLQLPEMKEPHQVEIDRSKQTVVFYRLTRRKSAKRKGGAAELGDYVTGFVVAALTMAAL